MAKSCCAGSSEIDSLKVGNQDVGISDLKGILERAYKRENLSDRELKRFLISELKAHNYVPASVERQYSDALWAEFKSYRAQRKGWIEEKYHRIPREEIQWFPSVDREKCTGCSVCIDMCHQGVYTFDGKAKVTNPYRCVVSCTGCMTMCPEEAISFPTLVQLREELNALRKRHKLRR